MCSSIIITTYLIEKKTSFNKVYKSILQKLISGEDDNRMCDKSLEQIEYIFQHFLI